MNHLLRALNSWRGRIWQARHLSKPNPEEVEVSFISYPKSGRTWLRFLIGAALTSAYKVDRRFIPETYHLTRQLPVPTMNFVHNGMDPDKADRFRYGVLPGDQDRFRQRHVCFLVRDPRDILASAFYWATLHRQIYSGDLSQFIRSDEHGIRKIIQFYNHWHAGRSIPKSFHLISYESLQVAPFEILRDLFEYLQIVIAPELLEKAIQFAEFDNMRRWERRGKSRFLTPADPNNEQTYKTRSGSVGSYLKELSGTDVNFLNSVLKEMGCPFLQEVRLTRYHDYGV